MKKFASFQSRVELLSHSWYHFLSLYLSIKLWAFCEKLSASDIMRAVRSSSCDNFSPRSKTIWCAMFTSPVALATRSRSASFGPGICFATVRDARPLDSPTAILFCWIIYLLCYLSIETCVCFAYTTPPDRDFSSRHRISLWRNSL